jgi:sporulation protein YlmC with PRC-barrel domain
VTALGDDAVLIESRSTVRDATELGDADRRIEQLRALKVVTEDGTYLGPIETVHVEPTSGNLTAFEVGISGQNKRETRAGSRMLIDAERVKLIGMNILIVPHLAAERRSAPAAN